MEKGTFNNCVRHCLVDSANQWLMHYNFCLSLVFSTFVLTIYYSISGPLVLVLFIIFIVQL